MNKTRRHFAFYHFPLYVYSSVHFVPMWFWIVPSTKLGAKMSSLGGSVPSLKLFFVLSYKAKTIEATSTYLERNVIPPTDGLYVHIISARYTLHPIDARCSWEDRRSRDGATHPHPVDLCSKT